MFHQLQILLADRNELKFLWRFSKDSPIDTKNECPFVWKNRFSLLLKLGI